MGVGMPSDLLLQEFGSQLMYAFDTVPYHVGSSLNNKSGWRDVDVRVILDDDVWDSMGLGDPDECHDNGKWVALCLAFSLLGKQITGLPIDFQLQRRTQANERFPGNRSAIGMTPQRRARYKDG